MLAVFKFVITPHGLNLPILSAFHTRGPETIFLHPQSQIQPDKATTNVAMHLPAPDTNNIWRNIG
jgi:hypothetical protein